MQRVPSTAGSERDRDRERANLGRWKDSPRRGGGEEEAASERGWLYTMQHYFVFICYIDEDYIFIAYTN